MQNTVAPLGGDIRGINFSLGGKRLEDVDGFMCRRTQVAACELVMENKLGSLKKISVKRCKNYIEE